MQHNWFQVLCDGLSHRLLGCIGEANVRVCSQAHSCIFSRTIKSHIQFESDLYSSIVWVTSPSSTTLVCRFHYNCRRERPASRLRNELSPRTPMQLQYLLCLKRTQFESCPSGDVAGAVVLASSLWFETGCQWIWVVVPLSAFGRVYYRAHYIADTIAGFFLGIIAFTALRVTDMTSLIPLHPYFSTLFSVIVQVGVASVLLKVVSQKLGLKSKRSTVLDMLFPRK